MDTPNTTSAPSEIGRRLRRNEDSGRALVAGWQASGLSQREFARQAGVPTQRIAYWRLRLERDAQQPLPAAGFIEIARPTQPSAMVVVELANGSRLRVERGFDAEVLRAVVAALSDRTTTGC